ncbi:NAD dependent epimerase/dehydratase [Colletotrichum fioriniae PJ7]|uniref:NAD dependent epimerase/dehydratase n=1 Tax=Colletotrichum fioriniae PJ7 TaxID=1445577 RepID=A0A010SN63_9PEZI|nr:NAD dependent epimerase/dehydratase [Colletotrichum fioriniae PJ7]
MASHAQHEKFALPQGSDILVTGANGFIGSHVCKELLQIDFNVKEAVRDTKKCSWLTQALGLQTSRGHFTLVALPSMEIEENFHVLMQGVSAVIHVASPVSFSTIPQDVIPTSVAGALNALKATNKSPAVKRFVLTSSSVAAALPRPEEEGVEVSFHSWNTDSVISAWQEGHDDPQRAWHVYTASKVEAEGAVWDFHRSDTTRRADLIINTDQVNQGHASTSSFIQSMWYGMHSDRLSQIPAQYFVDVQDTARLHVAGAVLHSVQNERIFAWAEPWNFNRILEILRIHYPQRMFLENFHHEHDLSSVSGPRSRALEILNQLGRDGFVSLEDSILGNVQDLAQSYNRGKGT